MNHKGHTAFPAVQRRILGRGRQGRCGGPGASAGLALVICFALGCESQFDGLEGDTSWIESREMVYFLGAVAESEQNAIHVIRMDGTGRRRLSSAPARHYALSPDGSMIAAVLMDGSCEVIDIDSGRTTALVGPCVSAEWNPSGEVILVGRPADSVDAYDISTQSLHEAIKCSKVDMEGPHWATSGDIVYYCNRVMGWCYALDLKFNRVEYRGKFKDTRLFWREVVGLERVHINQTDWTIEGWINASCPVNDRLAVVKDGSLWVEDRKGRIQQMLLANTNLWKSDFGPEGFSNPCWSADGRYVLGDADGRVVIAVDTITRRSGVVARGQHPLVRLPGYNPLRRSKPERDYYYLTVGAPSRADESRSE